MAHMEYHNNQVTMTEIFYNSHKSLIEKIGLHLELEPEKIDDLTMKFIGEPLKLKAMKDPNKPKRAKTSYMYFCQDHREKLKKDNPKMKMVEISKLLGQLWSTLSEKDKKEYVKSSEKDKERYQEDIEKYKQIQHY